MKKFVILNAFLVLKLLFNLKEIIMIFYFFSTIFLLLLDKLLYQ